MGSEHRMAQAEAEAELEAVHHPESAPRVRVAVEARAVVPAVEAEEVRISVEARQLDQPTTRELIKTGLGPKRRGMLAISLGSGSRCCAMANGRRQ